MRPNANHDGFPRRRLERLGNLRYRVYAVQRNAPKRIRFYFRVSGAIDYAKTSCSDGVRGLKEVPRLTWDGQRGPATTACGRYTRFFRLSTELSATRNFEQFPITAGKRRYLPLMTFAATI